ncbi:MAG: hypothetical protein AB1805_16095, partial [Nitrospirota bacterium]
MKKYLIIGVLAMVLLVAASVGYAYELGTRDMVTGAGRATVAKPARTYTKQITAPGVLNQSNTEYVLMNDVVANGTAFTIQGSNITLNLNGKKVTYLNANASTAYGVKIDGYARNNIAIVNGTIQQGAGTCSGNQNGYGCNPLYAYDSWGLELGGLDITWRAADTGGIYLHWGGKANIHHNTLNDLGSTVVNRHQGIDVIKAANHANSVISHNLIKRARHRGIMSGPSNKVYNNDVYIDSVVTNSTGVSINSGEAHHNRIYGKGVHPIGIWPGNNVKVYSNYVEVQNTKWGSEYGDTGSAGLRMTWGNNNVEVMYNTFIVKASNNYNGTGV